MRFKLLLILSLCFFTAHGQTDVIIKDLIETLEDDLPDDFDLSEFTEKLEQYYKHPINLNKTDAEELKNLFFLSPVQIKSLLNHISENGALLDIVELQSIDGFDLTTIERLKLFVIVKPVGELKKFNFKNIISQGEHDLLLRYSRIPEKQKGFTAIPGSRYLGSPFKALLRYSYKSDGLFSISIVSKKDAGEYLIGPNKFPDFVSGNISFSKIGSVKKLVLGDFSLQFGQGLTLWSGFSFGKGSDVTTITKKDLGLKPYSSANEYSFLRGAATTLSIRKNLEFTSFISSRKLDGSLLSEAEDSELSTVSETGLHRTPNEIKNRKTLQQLIYGGTIQYAGKNLAIGLIGYRSHYDHAFIASPRIYDKFNFTGESLTNIGFNYNYTFRNIYFFGEIANSIGTGSAYLNGALISLSSTVSVSILHRDYDKTYHNFFNQAVSESTTAANEQGLFTGINIMPNKHWTFSLYADQFKFPWLKFRVDAPSKGFEFLSQIAFSPTKTFKIVARYKSELKHQNSSETTPISFLENVFKDDYRINLSWRLNKVIGFQNIAELIRYRKGQGKIEFGYMIYQDIDFVLNRSKLSGNLRLAFFNTPSYDSRIYAYESDVLYGFAFGMYNGMGYRSYLNLKYKLIKKLDLWARYAVFIYPKNLTVGSGLDEITGNKKQEIKLQVRYQF